MQYILIDTNCWMELLTNDDRGKLLELLEFWNQNGYVSFLTPQVVRDDEWPDKSRLYLAEYYKAKKTTSGGFTPGDGIYSSLLETADQLVIQKVERVNKLVQSGIYYKYSRKVMADIVYRERKKLAPFHNKARNSADALIFFSTVHDYLQKKGVSEFIFVTANKKDFSDPATNTSLHPGLHTEGLTINYFISLHQAGQFLKKELPLPPEQRNSGDIDYCEQYVLGDSQSKKHLLDRVHTALTTAHDMIGFVPLHMLHRIYPFRVLPLKDSYTDYAGYTIVTNNQKLYELFAAAQPGKNGKLKILNPEVFKGVRDYKSKLSEVYNILNTNLVFNIDHRSGQMVSIKLNSSETCNCVKCSMLNFNILPALKKLKEQPVVPQQEKMRMAYTHAVIGNFENAFLLYHDVYTLAKKDKKPLLEFICLLNLKKIGLHIRWTFSKTNEPLTSYLEQLAGVFTVNELFKNIKLSRFELDNMLWLEGEHFYSVKFRQNTETIRQIRDHHFRQFQGGWSNNSNLKTLLCQFAQLENYLERNFLFYYPKEIRTFFEELYEGLLMSLQFNDKQSSRIDYFSDYLLIRIARYVDPEVTLKYLRQLRIKDIPYKNNTKEQSRSFPAIVLQYFERYPLIKKHAESKLEKNSFFFHEMKTRTTFNFVLLAALINFPKGLMNKLMVSIIKTCRQDIIFHPTEYKYLAELIWRKGHLLTIQTIKVLLKQVLTNIQFHDKQVCSALSVVIKKHFPTLRLTTEQEFQLLNDQFLVKFIENPRSLEKECIQALFPILNDKLQAKVRMILINTLKKDFNREAYFYFAVYDVIESDELWSIYLKTLPPAPKDLTRAGLFFDQGEVLIREFSDLLNLSFKNKKELPPSLLIPYKGLSKYYDWLINMEGFNYRYFNPLWILEYNTGPYYRKIFSSDKVRKYLAKWLKENHHPKIKELYLELVIPNKKQK